MSNMLNKIPEDNHWWFASRTRALNSIMRQFLPRTANFRLLDIGCGGGNMIHHLSEYGQVTGLEIDGRPLKIARQRGYEVVQLDATQPMPFGANRFDVVTAFDVIEHNQDDLAILADSWRVLKPGGYVIITVPAFMELWSHNDDLNAHVRRYTDWELRRKMAMSGFEVRRVTFNNFFVFPLAATLILLRRARQAKPELASHHLTEKEYQVEMEPTSPPVNVILSMVGQLEAALMGRFDLPIGTSLIAIGQKRISESEGSF